MNPTFLFFASVSISHRIFRRNELKITVEELEAITEESRAVRADSTATLERLREEAEAKRGLLEQASALKESEKDVLESRYVGVVFGKLGHVLRYAYFLRLLLTC